MMPAPAQAVTDTQGNVYFCKFDRHPDRQAAAGGRARLPILADIKCAVVVINTALKDILAANAESSRQAAGNSRLMLDAVGLIDNVAFKCNNLTLEAARGAAQSDDLAGMLGEVHQLVQQGATAASELRSLAYEHKVRVASAAGLLQKIGNRVAVVEQLMAEQVERRSAGRITVATPEQGTGNGEWGIGNSEW